MKKEVNMDCLVIEITRKCNMNCDHCLRGSAQDKDIDFNILDAILDNVGTIGNVVFTGGEPSLNIKAMTYFREEAEKRNKEIRSFYLVTNGKTNALPLSIELLKLYAYCVKHDDETLEYSGLALSQDMYHDDINQENEMILRGLSFFREDKMYSDKSIRKIINEGNAQENGISNFSIEKDSVSIIDWDDSFIHVDSIVYFNVNGDVIPGCDYSYETQENIKLGNILERDLSDILLEEESSYSRLENNQA